MCCSISGLICNSLLYKLTFIISRYSTGTCIIRAETWCRTINYFGKRTIVIVASAFWEYQFCIRSCGLDSAWVGPSQSLGQVEYGYFVWVNADTRLYIVVWNISRTAVMPVYANALLWAMPQEHDVSYIIRHYLLNLPRENILIARYGLLCYCMYACLCTHIWYYAILYSSHTHTQTVLYD